MKQLGELRVAIIHDWLIGGGAERVVQELHRMFPEAPIYTSYATEEWRQKLDDKVVTGYLQHFPSLRKYVPFLRAIWFSRLDLRDYDLVISSSGAEAKAVRVTKPTIHINYCHAPTHYYWDRYDDYLQSPGFPKGLNWLARLGLKFLIGPMRRWDYKAAQRADYIIANSAHTKAKIKQYYGRDSEIIYPPVDTDRFAGSTAQKRHGFVIAGRQTPYKRIDLAVAACTKLGVDLTVLGNGPDHAKLVRNAGPTISFVTNASDDQVGKYFGAAEAFIFPNIDDFGIVAVEAMAAGTPVIALEAGGALDYVIPRKTGLLFSQPTVDSLCLALQEFKPANFDEQEIKRQAQRFSPAVFKTKMLEAINSCLAIS